MATDNSNNLHSVSDTFYKLCEQEFAFKLVSCLFPYCGVDKKIISQLVLSIFNLHCRQHSRTLTFLCLLLIYGIDKFFTRSKNLSTFILRN